MKKTLSFIICHFALSVALLSLTSCLGDSDDNSTSQGLTKEQIHRCYLQMAGDHAGKLYFEKYEKAGSSALTSDSINVTWTVNSDSVITIHDVPASVLGTMTQGEALKTAIEAAGDMELKVYYRPYNASPISFTLYPEVAKTNVYYNEATHSVTFAFIANTYSWGEYDSGKMRLQLVQYGIYLDDNAGITYLASQVPLVLLED